MTDVYETYVDAPVVTPAPSGLLDHATVVNSERSFGWRNEEGIFESYNCLNTAVPTTICPEDPKVVKDFEEAEWAPGVTISVYGGVVCRLVGLDREKARRSLEQAFLLNEHRGVERALMETRFQADTSPDLLWPPATDITPAGGAVSPQCAVAMLEGHAGQVYAGLPTLHLPRVIASQVVNPESTVGNLFYSDIGSKLVNGTGYTPSTGPAGVAPAEGETWSWVTGEVVVEKGPIRSIDAVDATNNENFILVERSYRVAVDCFAAGILTAVCA